MKRRMVGLMAVLALVATACGTDSTADTVAPETTATPETTAAPETTVATETTAAPETTAASDTTAPTETTVPAPQVLSECAADAPAVLRVWTDEARSTVMTEVAPGFTEETGVCVQVEILEFGQIRDQVGIAGPAGEGPDVFIGAHDWTGQLVADGAIDAIDLGAAAGDFVDVALDAFTYDGSLFAAPYATEAIALYYNTELSPDAPATWDEVVATCDALEGLENCVGVTGGAEVGDAYHHYPFLSAQGGYIFAYDPETGFDVSDVGLDSDGAIAGIQFLADQVESGIVGSVNYDTAKQLFLDGTEPFWMTGPWEVGALNDQTGVSWGVTKIPTMNGNTPAPFVGAQGIFLSAFSENKIVAQSFILDYLATEDGMRALYEADPRNPAHIAVLESIADDPVAAVFAASAEDGVPMPNIPEMGAVWDPLGANLLLVRTGDITADEAMTTAAAAVRTAVSGN